MAHKKAASAGVRQGVNVAGKRLGVKVSGGQKVKIGSIIIRQKGTKYYPGRNTSMGRDFTIYAIAPGVVSFRNMTGSKRGRKAVDVVLQ